MNGSSESASLRHRGPLPLPGKHHRRPLEARSNWDPWLPATEAYPDVPAVLRIVTVAVLVTMLLIL
jgi:hypothetical protein